MRDEEFVKDILLGLFLVCVLTLAFIYFNLPEREAFIQNQIAWWHEFSDMIGSFR